MPEAKLAPLAGLLLAAPALVLTGLLQTAHATYGELPNGFYSLDTMLCESVFRALLGEARAEGAARIDPVALGRVLVEGRPRGSLVAGVKNDVVVTNRLDQNPSRVAI